MAVQPRTTRKKPKAATPNSEQTSSLDNADNIFDNTYNALSSLSWLQSIGICVSAVALLSTVIVSRSSKNKNKSISGGDTEDIRKQQMAASLGLRRPKGYDSTSSISNETVTKYFQQCLSSKRPQQQVIADAFYSEIRKWKKSQLQVNGQTIIVNFLFWYYRSMNVPEIKFHWDQAEHIRYWANYELNASLKWDYYNIKFDYIYSTALLEKSIPQMRKFYKWVTACIPRQMPADATSKKPNYYLTRFQAACILGDWDNGVKVCGKHIQDLATAQNPVKKSETKGAITSATRSDYFMHYTLRSLELPGSNPNFGLIYKIVDQLQHEFDAKTMAPPVFANWNILSLKYRNENFESVTSDIDQQYIFSSDRIRDDDGFYKFYPQTNNLTARLNKKVNIWGRVCQMVSPILGAAGFLPMTGSWNDTKMYLQNNWSYRANGCLCTKHVICKVERTPFEVEVESNKNFFAKAVTEKGYVWNGQIQVFLKKSQMNEGDKLVNEGYFDGEKELENENVTKQTYFVEMVINKNDINTATTTSLNGGNNINKIDLAKKLQALSNESKNKTKKEQM